MLALAPRPRSGAGRAGATCCTAGADVAAEVEARGSRADFLVLARPAAGDDRATREAFRAALLQERAAGADGASRLARPMRSAVRVAVAWRDDPQTMKALIPALRLLGQAEQVHLLAGVRDGRASARHPVRAGRARGAATLHVLAIGTRAVRRTLLLGRAHELGADMLVMGAFARGPMREALFGGVTRHMLAHADLPVLMRY